MKVVGLAPKVEEILKVTQLYQVFPEFPDEASALESFPEAPRRKHPEPQSGMPKSSTPRRLGLRFPKIIRKKVAKRREAARGLP